MTETPSASGPARQASLRELRPAGSATPEALYHGRRRRPDGRPWVMVNMVASLDGATAVQGRSGGLGGPVDRAVFHALRADADLILAGRATVESENYGPPKKAGQQVAVVTANPGKLSLSRPLWTSGRGIVVTTADAAVPDGIATVRAGHDQVDLPEAIAELGRRFGPTTGSTVILSEGGPGLNNAMIAADLVDEWCLTMAAQLVGGDSARLAQGRAAPSAPEAMAVVHVGQAEEGLFIRAVRRSLLDALPATDELPATD